MKKWSFYILLICIALFMTACSSSSQASNGSEVRPYHNDISSYRYEENSRFKILDREIVQDGTSSNIRFLTLVDKETKVMYMYMEKFRAGYGISLVPLIDAEGNPLLYEGDLN